MAVDAILQGVLAIGLVLLTLLHNALLRKGKFSCATLRGSDDMMAVTVHGM